MIAEALPAVAAEADMFETIDITTLEAGGLTYGDVAENGAGTSEWWEKKEEDHSGWPSAVAVRNTATAEGNSSYEEKKTWARNQPAGDVSQLYNINSLCCIAETTQAG